MLAHFGPNNAILAATLERIEKFSIRPGGPKDRDLADKILADPIDERFCHLTAERGGRGNLDGKVVLGNDSLVATQYRGRRTLPDRQSLQGTGTSRGRE